MAYPLRCKTLLVLIVSLVDQAGIILALGCRESRLWIYAAHLHLLRRGLYVGPGPPDVVVVVSDVRIGLGVHVSVVEQDVLGLALVGGRVAG
jgi:hypothetical protein